MECAAKGRVATPCPPGPPGRRCGLCGAVAYCTASHQMLHWNDHREECSRLQEQMRRADILSDFPLAFSTEATTKGCKEQMERCDFLMSMGLHEKGMWKWECSCSPAIPYVNNSSRILDDWHLPSFLCPCTDPINPILTALKNWGDYYQWRCLPLNSPVALLLHWPLTLYHSFQISSAQSLIPEVGGKLHIHYLGPEKELLQLAAFAELQALFPDIEIHIDFVGPAVPQFWDGETIRICKYARCMEEGCLCNSSCTISGRDSDSRSTIILKFRRGYYHERYNDMIKDSSPHLILAPNAGVAAYPDWSPTIELINKIGIPAIFTDFCEEAAYLASRCISFMTGRSLRLPIQINPFRQPMVVEDSALYLPCFSNCFIFGI